MCSTTQPIRLRMSENLGLFVYQPEGRKVNMKKITIALLLSTAVAAPAALAGAAAVAAAVLPIVAVAGPAAAVGCWAGRLCRDWAAANCWPAAETAGSRSATAAASCFRRCRLEDYLACR